MEHTVHARQRHRVMGKDEKEIRELRRLLRDLVALATTPAVWVGRDRGQIAEGVADVLLHTLRADAVYVRLQSANEIEVVRSARHPGFSDEVRRLWPQPETSSLHVDTITGSAWPNALRVAMQSIGISGDDGFVVVGSADPAFPNESQALLLSVAANQIAVALQAARLRMQAELERHRMQDLLAKAPAAIGLLAGPEHRWVYVNENYVWVTGRDSASHFLGKTLRESLPEIEDQPFLELLDNVYRSGEPYIGREMKTKLSRTHTGQPEECYFDFVYQPIRDGDGIVEGILVHAVEVTDKVMVRQEVERRERQFREMIDALPAAIYTTDAEGRLTHYNPAAVEFSGRTPELRTDQWCVSWKLYYPDGRPMPHDECPMAIALKEGRIIQGAEAIAERPDGTRRWFIPYPTPIRDGQGTVIGGINMLLDITDRKQAEEAMAHLAAIVASSDDAIISKNLDGIIQSWNKSAELMFGYPAEEAIGKHIAIIVPEDRRDEEKNILNRLRSGDKIYHFQTIRCRKDGSTLDLSLTISPVRDSAGRVIGASNVARDITHLKQIERALRDSEERFRAMVETTPECVKVVAPDGTLQHMNSAGLAMVGAKLADAVIGKSIFELIAPEDREKFRAFNERICRGDKDSLEFDMIGLDGMRHHMETHAAPLHNPDGRVVQLAITHDVTERKRAEHALRESEQRYRAVTDASPIMVWMSGTDKLCYYFNKGWLDFVGRTLEQESGNGWAENVHPEDFDRCLQIYVHSFDTGQPFEMEYRLRHHSGQYRWIIDHGTPRYALDGTFEGYVGGCLDIHDQKEAAEKTRSAEIRLQLMKMQDEERRHIARELHDSAGQTLTVLGMSLAQLAQKTGRRAPEITTDVEKLQETVQQLHREIRTTSYLLHPPLLDENGLYSAIHWYMDGLRERSDSDIRLDIPEDFGRLPRDMELVIFRLVQESLTNIHRHSGSKTASIRMARESGQITLDIQDEGKGISPERLAEIRSGRSGVGIRGMQERLRQFEGRMTIDSGSFGTRIFVTIPIPKAPPPAEQSKTEPLQAAV